MVVGTFGPLTFECSRARVYAPRDVKREVKARYEEHKVLLAKPRLEFLAPELVTVSLTVQFSALFGVHPAAALIEIEGLIENGQVERLILGGMNHGFHIIESSSEEWRHALPDGRLISAGTTLQFKEYIK